jgi:hypothetical protein
MVLNTINSKQHLTTEGLQKIVSIKAALNMGLSGTLKCAFPNIVSVVRPEVETPQIKDPY